MIQVIFNQTFREIVHMIIFLSSTGAIARLAEFCEVEVCPEPRAYTRAELLKGVVGKDALLILPHDKIDAELVEHAGPQLKVVATHSVGYDHINQEVMKAKGIKVGYTPGILSDDVADLSICLTLMTLRKVKEHVKYVKHYLVNYSNMLNKC